eukprot:scaffold538_cov412-Prasinococcus_capsulatus_cf.AAC.7
MDAPEPPLLRPCEAPHGPKKGGTTRTGCPFFGLACCRGRTRTRTRTLVTIGADRSAPARAPGVPRLARPGHEGARRNWICTYRRSCLPPPC